MSPSLTPIERRLVAALDASAAQVTSADLRAPAPPAGPIPARRWLAAVVGMAAVLVAVACFAVLFQAPDSSAPTRPLAPGGRPKASAAQSPAALTPQPSHPPTPMRSDGSRPAARSTSTLPGAVPSALVPSRSETPTTAEVSATP